MWGAGWRADPAGFSVGQPGAARRPPSAEGPGLADTGAEVVVPWIFHGRLQGADLLLRFGGVGARSRSRNRTRSRMAHSSIGGARAPSSSTVSPALPLSTPSFSSTTAHVVANVVALVDAFVVVVLVVVLVVVGIVRPHRYRRRRRRAHRGCRQHRRPCCRPCRPFRPCRPQRRKRRRCLACHRHRVRRPRCVCRTSRLLSEILVLVVGVVLRVGVGASP